MKYPVGTLLKGHKPGEGSDTKTYRVIKCKNDKIGTMYDVLQLDSDRLFTDIRESTIDCYISEKPMMLDERLFTL